MLPSQSEVIGDWDEFLRYTFPVRSSRRRGRFQWWVSRRESYIATCAWSLTCLLLHPIIGTKRRWREWLIYLRPIRGWVLTSDNRKPVFSPQSSKRANLCKITNRTSRSPSSDSPTNMRARKRQETIFYVSFSSIRRSRPTLRRVNRSLPLTMDHDWLRLQRRLLRTSFCLVSQFG